MIQIAYLILAHQQPNLCRRLIETLSSDSTRIFVHVDARVDSCGFIVRHPNVMFLGDRLKVNRGGWSLTSALVRTLRAAFVSSDCHYFVFLAGTDYPIKSSRYISSFIEGNYPLNFINYYPLLEGASGTSNVTRYHFVDYSLWLARALHLSTQGADNRDDKFPGLVRRLNEMLPVRSFPSGLVPFRGSDRWCLNRDTVRYVLDCWDSPEGRRYRRYLKYTWGSDEMFFQTVIFNSEWSHQCHLYDGEAVREIVAGRREPWNDEVKAYLHYIDWDTSREDPAILDERDFDRLKQTHALFACKFHQERSAKLLELVDKHLLEK